jgi:DNA-binding NtrC family response regulator
MGVGVGPRSLVFGLLTMHSDPVRPLLGDDAGTEPRGDALLPLDGAIAPTSGSWKPRTSSVPAGTPTISPIVDVSEVSRVSVMSAMSGMSVVADADLSVEHNVDTGLIPPQVKRRIRVLIIQADRGPCGSGCGSVLTGEGYDVTIAPRGDEAMDLIKRRGYDIILLDLATRPVPATQILVTTLQQHPRTIVIAMSDRPSVRASVEILAAGAWDYLPQPFSATHLAVLVGRAAHAIVAARETRDVRLRLLKENGNSEKILLLGIAPAFRQAVALARKVAATDASVMICGESGTGKELIAQFIHHHSRRAGHRLVAINCAAMPETLLESEMFGHRKGAFTGADREKPGLFETANGGTFFLDEFTEMSQPLQAKLLRVIQDGVVRRVGSEREDALVDVRFVSATNRDPQEAVDAGVLREDLFYRLRVVPIKLPSLRQRPEDIPLLASHFLAHYWQEHRPASDRVPLLTDAAIEFLQTRSWRGNVRELQNVIEHLTVVADPGQEIEPQHIPLETDAAEEETALVNGSLPARLLTEPYHAAKDKFLAHFQEAYMSRLIARAGGNFSKAARLADIDRTTLYRFMEKHGLLRDALADS